MLCCGTFPGDTDDTSVAKMRNSGCCAVHTAAGYEGPASAGIAGIADGEANLLPAKSRRTVEPRRAMVAGRENGLVF